MVAEFDYPSLDTSYNLVFVFLELAVLQNMLNHIVSKLILGKLVNLHKDLGNDWSSESVLCVLQNSLDYSAAICVVAEVASILNYWLEDEVNAVTWHFLNALLNHMVSILVIDAVQDGILQFSHQQLLLVKGNYLQSFLNYSATVH